MYKAIYTDIITSYNYIQEISRIRIYTIILYIHIYKYYNLQVPTYNMYKVLPHPIPRIILPKFGGGKGGGRETYSTIYIYTKLEK